jgi:uncharacterized protein YaaW (UPF0174 family)
MGIVYKDDKDLDFLRYCSEEDIQGLANILMFDPEDGQKRLASEIAGNEEFRALEGNSARWRRSWKLIAGELQNFGGNTIANVVRGTGILYNEILRDVCDKIEVAYKKDDSTETIEEGLLDKIIGKLDLSGGIKRAATSTAVAMGTAELVAGTTTTTGATVAGRTATAFVAGRAATALIPPLLIASTLGHVVYEAAGPAYRVTIPATVRVAQLRKKYRDQEDTK